MKIAASEFYKLSVHWDVQAQAKWLSVVCALSLSPTKKLHPLFWTHKHISSCKNILSGLTWKLFKGYLPTSHLQGIPCGKLSELHR